MRRGVGFLMAVLLCSTLCCREGRESAADRKAGEGDRDERMRSAVAEIMYDVPAKIDINYEALDEIDISASPLGVVPLPKEVGRTLNGLFSKYTKHLAPNGKPIHIFAQSGVNDLQVVRARDPVRERQDRHRQPHGRCQGDAHLYRYRGQIVRHPPHPAEFPA
jgi:hypothetical protein